MTELLYMPMTKLTYARTFFVQYAKTRDSYVCVCTCEKWHHVEMAIKCSTGQWTARVVRVCDVSDPPNLTSWKSRGARAPVPHSWRRQWSSLIHAGSWFLTCQIRPDPDPNRILLTWIWKIQTSTTADNRRKITLFAPQLEETGITVSLVLWQNFYTVSQKKLCKLIFLSELCQISTDCKNFWHKDSRENRFFWGVLVFHLT